MPENPSSRTRRQIAGVISPISAGKNPPLIPNRIALGSSFFHHGEHGAHGERRLNHKDTKITKRDTTRRPICLLLRGLRVFVVQLPLTFSVVSRTFRTRWRGERRPGGGRGPSGRRGRGTGRRA